MPIVTKPFRARDYLDTPEMMLAYIDEQDAEIERLRALLISCRKAMEVSAANGGYTDWQHMIAAINETVYEQRTGQEASDRASVALDWGDASEQNATDPPRCPHGEFWEACPTCCGGEQNAPQSVGGALERIADRKDGKKPYR